MNIQVNQVDDIIILVLDGMLTIGSEQVFADILQKQLQGGSKKIVLDMTRVKFIDSLGIGQIAGGFTTLNENGGKLVLARINDKVKELLRLTGLQNHIQTFPTVEEALQEL